MILESVDGAFAQIGIEPLSGRVGARRHDCGEFYRPQPVGGVKLAKGCEGKPGRLSTVGLGGEEIASFD